jgi:hypothetical protein
MKADVINGVYEYSQSSHWRLSPSLSGCRKRHTGGWRAFSRGDTRRARRPCGAHHFAKEEAIVLLREALELGGALGRAAEIFVDGAHRAHAALEHDGSARPRPRRKAHGPSSS